MAATAGLAIALPTTSGTLIDVDVAVLAPPVLVTLTLVGILGIDALPLCVITFVFVGARLRSALVDIILAVKAVKTVITHAMIIVEPHLAVDVILTLTVLRARGRAALVHLVVAIWISVGTGWTLATVLENIVDARSSVFAWVRLALVDRSITVEAMVASSAVARVSSVDARHS